MIKSHRARQFHGPVCTLGNQETWATYRDLEQYFRELACPFRPLIKPAAHSSQMFSRDQVLAQLARDFVHARSFFDMMGIEDYADLDAFDCDAPRVVHDLNYPVPNDLVGSCGLLVDGGTAEHVFDVRAVLTNIVRMLRIDGHVIHMTSFEIDHGFYAFSPCLFYDFYTANGFEDIQCFVLQLDYANILKTYRDPVPVFEYRYGMALRDRIDHRRQPAIFFLARKCREVEEISVPVQGIYAHRAGQLPKPREPMPSEPDPARSLFETWVPRWMWPALQPVRPYLARSHAAISRRMRPGEPTEYI